MNFASGMGARSTTRSHKWWSWRGGWGWGNWDMWRSTRRASRPTPRRIRPTASRNCERPARRFANAEGAGTTVASTALREWQQQLEQIPVRLQQLKKSGLQKLSRTDADSRFLRERRGFTLGYTATVAISDDHLIVAQQVSQEVTDHGLLLPMVEAVQRTCRERPRRVSADSGFFSIDNVQAMEEKKIDAYVPDTHLARVLNRGGELKQLACHPVHQRMRRKLRSPSGRAIYLRRKALAEPMLGVLKEQRGMRRFRLRGLRKVAAEFALSSTALNLTRLWKV